jgi:hypothetical protein
VSANKEKKAGCYALQSDRLREHQDERGYCVLDSILIKHRFEPVTQKMKNKVEVERDKDAVDDQLDDKIRKGTFSGIFHTMIVGIGPGLPRMLTFLTDVRGRILQFASRPVAARPDRAPYELNRAMAGIQTPARIVRVGR